MFFKLMKSFFVLVVFLLLFLRISLVSPSSRLRANLGLVSRMAGSYKEATRKLHGNPIWWAIGWLPLATRGWNQLRNNTIHDTGAGNGICIINTTAAINAGIDIILRINHIQCAINNGTKTPTHMHILMLVFIL